MPDPSHSGLDAPASPLDAAQVLEAAADLLLVHGRCRTAAYADDGSLCVLAALCDAAGRDIAARRVAEEALSAHIKQRGHVPYPVVWNEREDDDFKVIDTLRHAAKDIRNEAAPA